VPLLSFPLCRFFGPTLIVTRMGQFFHPFLNFFAVLSNFFVRWILNLTVKGPAIPVFWRRVVYNFKFNVAFFSFNFNLLLFFLLVRKFVIFSHLKLL
jgi:hypothetical protein